MQSMASFVSQNVWWKIKACKVVYVHRNGVGLLFGCLVFVLILLKGDVLASLFSTDAAVIQKGFDYLEGLRPGNKFLTAIMFSMVGYFNGNNQTLWVMFQGLFQTLGASSNVILYSIQPDASLTKWSGSTCLPTLVEFCLI